MTSYRKGLSKGSVHSRGNNKKALNNAQGVLPNKRDQTGMLIVNLFSNEHTFGSTPWALKFRPSSGPPSPSPQARLMSHSHFNICAKDVDIECSLPRTTIALGLFYIATS